MTALRASLGVIVLSVAVGFEATAEAQQAVATYTLQEAQRLALGNYQTIQTAQEQVGQARLLRRQATGAVLPTVTVNTVGTRNFFTGAFDFGGRRVEVLPAFDYNLSLSITQPIYAGLRDLKTREQADLNIGVTGRGLQATMQDALLETTRAYYQVLSARENVAISTRAAEVARETLRVANVLVRAGEEPETSALRARVATSEAQRELLEAKNAETLALQQLAILIGADTEFDVVRPAPVAHAVEPLDDLIGEAWSTRAELRSLDLQRRIAELEVEKQRGQYQPVLRAEGTYVKRRASFPSDQLSSVSVNATWTIFEGGRIAADVATARSRLRQVELQRDLLRRQVEQQVRAAYLAIETLSASLDLVTAQAEFARRNATSTDRAFRVGEATDLDLLTANQAVTRAERQLSVTGYMLEVARHELGRATGRFAAELMPVASGGEQQ